MRTLLASVALLLAGAAAMWFWHPWQPTAEGPRYRVAKVERGPLAATVLADATLNAEVTVQVGAPVSGRIKELRADFNSKVTKGEVIARLDPTVLASRVAQAEADLMSAEANIEVANGVQLARQADVRHAEAALEQARRDLDRRRGLVEQEFIARADLDSAEAAFNTAREALTLAQANQQAQLAQVRSSQAQAVQKQAALAQARADLARTVIRAPVSGTVISRDVEVGQTVAPPLQAPVLYTIAQDLSRMALTIAVDQADVGDVRVDQTVRFTTAAYPGQEFEGRIAQIRMAPRTGDQSVTYAVLATVDNAAQKLLPGMAAKVGIVTGERDNVVKVANEALGFRPAPGAGAAAAVAGPGRPGQVWLLKGGQPVPVAVRLGASDSRMTEILSGSLPVGSEVILGSENDAAGHPGGPGH